MNISSPLSLFFLVSLAIHTTVVMVVNNTMSITLPNSKGSVMAVKINKTKTVKEKNKTNVKNLTKTKYKLKKTITSRSKAFKKSNKISYTRRDKLLAPSSEKIAALSKAHVITRLHKELRQYFIYPRLAQKRNWQGKVLITLQVRTNGDIQNIRVSRSSGYRVLDNAAVDSIRKIMNISGLSSWLENDIVLNIPVIYQLTQS